VEGHQGAKGVNLTWLGRRERLFTVGFSKASDREFALWDPRNFSKALTVQSIDTGSGVYQPVSNEMSRRTKWWRWLFGAYIFGLMSIRKDL
jgi:hypothetical protein